jgi:hypothetical protein
MAGRCGIVPQVVESTRRAFFLTGTWKRYSMNVLGPPFNPDYHYRTFYPGQPRKLALLMDIESGRLLFGVVSALLAVFGYLAFLVTAVIVAEFIRRERTETKDDDWIERRKRD